MVAAAAQELGNRLKAAEARSLEQIAVGAPLSRILEGLLVVADHASGGDMLSSILVMDPDGKRLHHGAAPNLPSDYCAAIDGIEIGPGVGSCGTAAYLGHPVYVTDIETDPLWTDFRDLAGRHGLRACWSTPIEGPGGQVLGTFAIYHRSPRSPTPEELDVINRISQSVALAVRCWRDRKRA